LAARDRAEAGIATLKHLITHQEDVYNGLEKNTATSPKE
jgi:hypothetical protein